MPANYDHVNGNWPADMAKPTAQEAVSAAKRLYRRAMGKPFAGTFKLTSGRRYTGVRRGVFYVNPEGHFYGGWRDLVHDISHYAHRRLHPGFTPHSPAHRSLELDLAQYVVNSGWLGGKLISKAQPKAKPSADEKRVAEGARIAERIKAWERKEKRAQTALRKLRKSPALKAFQRADKKE